MGCGASVQTSSLEVSAPVNIESDSFEGAFLVVCGGPLKLDRDIRITLKLRATMVTLTGFKNKVSAEPEKEEQAHILWEVGGVVAKRGTVLEAGENRLEFNFPLQGKLKKLDTFIKPEELVKKFGACTYIQYDYILRGGSLQIKEFVRYPPVFPKGENGRRVIDKNHGGVSPGLVGSLVGGVAGLAF